MSIRDRKNKKSRKKFVGRKSELESFGDIIDELPPDYNIINVYGVGGIGKSSLLKSYVKEIDANNLPYAFIDFNKPQSQIDVMKAIRDSFDIEDFELFNDFLNDYYEIETKIKSSFKKVGKGLIAAAESTAFGAFATEAFGKDKIKSLLDGDVSSRDLDKYYNALNSLSISFAKSLGKYSDNQLVVVIFDTYEDSTTDFDNWFRNFIDSEYLSSNLVFIIAGRESLEDTNDLWREWKDIKSDVPLDVLSPIEAKELLTNSGITNDTLVDSIIRYTERFPWALELTIESLSSAEIKKEDLIELPENFEINEKIVARFLSQIVEDEDLYTLIQSCSILSHFDEDILNYLYPEDKINQVSLQKLRKFSFFKTRKDGKYYIHDIVREFLEKDFKHKSLQKWFDTVNKIIKYYRTKLNNVQKKSEGYYNIVTELFRYNIQVDEDLAIKDLMTFSRTIFGPIEYETFFSPIIGIANKAGLSSKSQSVVDFFESQLLAMKGQLKESVGLLHQIEDKVECYDIIRLSTYSSLCDLLHRLGEVDTALTTAINALEYSKGIKNNLYSSLFSARIAEMYGVKGKLIDSEAFCKKTVDFLNEVDNSYFKGQINLLLSHIYIFRNDYEKSEFHLNASFVIWNDNSDYGLAQVHSTYSWLYALNGKWKKGHYHGQQAYNYFADKGDDFSEGLTALNIAKLYRLQGFVDEAIKYNKLAYKKLKLVNSDLYKSISLEQLGNCYYDKSIFDKSISALKKAETLSEKVGIEYTLGSVLFLLGKCNFKSSNDEEAEKYFDRAEKILITCQNKYRIIELLIDKLDLGVEKHQSFIDLKPHLKLILSFLQENNFKDLYARYYLSYFKISYLKLNESKEKINEFSKLIFDFCRNALEYNPVLLYQIVDNFEEWIEEKKNLLDKSNLIEVLENFICQWKKISTTKERSWDSLEEYYRKIEFGKNKSVSENLTEHIKRIINDKLK